MNDVTVAFPANVPANVRRQIVDSLKESLPEVARRSVNVRESEIGSEPSVSVLVSDMDGVHPVTALRVQEKIAQTVTDMARDYLLYLDHKVSVIFKGSSVLAY